MIDSQIRTPTVGMIGLRNSNPQDQEHRAVADARQHGYAQVGGQFGQSRPGQRAAGCQPEVAQQHQVGKRRTQSEQDAGRQQRREVLPDHQHLAAHRREEVVMQALLDHLAAEQVHEDRHRAEENRQAQHKQLEHAGEHGEVLVAAAAVPATGVADGVRGEKQERRGGQQNHRDGALPGEVLLQLEPEDR
jgi:hypothetical protein